ncbi:MAG: hypothetical protein ABSG76_25655 [Xanthobacteraceae bacterium]
MFNEVLYLSNNGKRTMTTGKSGRRKRIATAEMRERHRSLVMRHAEIEGLVGGEKNARIGGRVSRRLLQAAKDSSGVHSDTDLLEYALARLALEDDFGDRLFRHEAKVSKDIDLEF